MSFLQSIGTIEVVVVAILLVVLFGGKKIPEFVRGLAQSVRELKKAK